MFGMSNLSGLTAQQGLLSYTADDPAGYVDYLIDRSEDASYLVKKQQEAERKEEAAKAEEKKKADALEKDTGVFSPVEGSAWSAAGSAAKEAEQFLLYSPMYRFSIVA